MEEGGRNLVIREQHYAVELSIEAGGKEDQGVIMSGYLCNLLILMKEYMLSP